MGEVSAYPLAWPAGWPRTSPYQRQAPRFTSSKQTAFSKSERTEIRLIDARERLSGELEKLKARDVILSTNMELRLDGSPRASAAAPQDPGAAVYFTLKKRPMVLACDRWGTVAGNVAAIAAHIGALRAQERWGVGSMEQAFTGYQALPAPDDWRALLANPSTVAEARAAWIAGLKECGNTGNKAVSLNAAMERARLELAP